MNTLIAVLMDKKCSFSILTLMLGIRVLDYVLLLFSGNTGLTPELIQFECRMFLVAMVVYIAAYYANKGSKVMLIVFSLFWCWSLKQVITDFEFCMTFEMFYDITLRIITTLVFTNFILVCLNTIKTYKLIDEVLVLK